MERTCDRCGSDWQYRESCDKTAPEGCLLALREEATAQCRTTLTGGSDD
jgi:hypothetical protein